MTMMKKLTAAQAKALQTIAENPGTVVNNWERTADLLTIRLTTGQALANAGLVKGEYTGRIMSHTYANGETHSVELIAWALTDQGREYLGM
jgi:aspartokinase